MRFLTDENIAKSVVGFLRLQGHDVKDNKEENLHGLPDNEILDMAIEENRIVLTHDGDFAGLLKKPIRHSGVILVRCKNQKPQNVQLVLGKFLSSNLIGKAKNKMTVISEKTIVIHEL